MGVAARWWRRRDARRVLRVGRVEVIDSKGRVRVVVGDDAQAAGVFLLDGRGQPRAAFATNPAGVSVTFSDDDANDAAVVGVLDGVSDREGEGSAVAWLLDRSDRTRFGARVWADGTTTAAKRNGR